MADKNSTALVLKKEQEVSNLITKNWDIYAKTVPSHIKPDDVNRLIFNLMRKPKSKLHEVDSKAVVNFALDCLDKGYNPDKEHVYPIVYNNKEGAILEAQKGYKAVLFDLEKAGIYAQFGFVHESEVYSFNKPQLKIEHIPSRKRIDSSIKFELTNKSGKLKWETQLDLIWVIYRDLKTKEVIDIFQMYVDDAIEHGLKYTKASPVKTKNYGKTVPAFIDQSNNWIKNTKAMITKTALLQGAKLLPTNIVENLGNIQIDNVRYQGEQKFNAYDKDTTSREVMLEEAYFEEVEEEDNNLSNPNAEDNKTKNIQISNDDLPY